MAHKLSDYGRRDVNLIERKIKDVLPEYFRAEYPDLVTFITAYYDFMNQDDDVNNFDIDVKQLFQIRDISETELANLNRIIKELSTGLENGDLFTDPRFTARRFADYFRSKGSENSIREFFRAFFQQEVEIEYPKKQMFIVGESEIGFNSLKFIQDYRLYQIYSILIKTGIGTQTWNTLYKKYVHPAGWYFQGQVVNEGEANLGLNSMPLSLADSSIGPILLSQASLDLDAPFIQAVALVENKTKYSGIDKNYISRYQTYTANELQRNFYNINDLVSPNAPTFDDSANSGGEADMAGTLYTMDGTRYTDSNNA